METIGKRVERAAKLRGIGFNELDRLIDLRPGYTSGLVNPRKGQKPRVPKADTLAVIAEKLGTTTEWLLSGADGSPPAPRMQLLPAPVMEGESPSNFARAATALRALHGDDAAEQAIAIAGGEKLQGVDQSAKEWLAELEVARTRVLRARQTPDNPVAVFGVGARAAVNDDDDQPPAAKKYGRR